MKMMIITIKTFIFDRVQIYLYHRMYQNLNCLYGKITEVLNQKHKNINS
jgi:hypothetical protein